MTPTSYYRGHRIYYNYETEKWYYEDNDEYIKSENRPCTRCGKTPTLSGADYCLKDLEVCDFINAACCGHGERIGYISLQDGRIFREIDSDDILFKMFRLENENKKLQEENKELGKNFDDLVNWASEIAKRNVVLDEKIGKLQQAIRIAYEKKPCPTIEDIQKEINNE